MVKSMLEMALRDDFRTFNNLDLAVRTSSLNTLADSFDSSKYSSSGVADRPPFSGVLDVLSDLAARNQKVDLGQEQVSLKAADFDAQELRRIRNILLDRAESEVEIGSYAAGDSPFASLPPGISGLNAIVLLELLEIDTWDGEAARLRGKIRDYIYDASARAGHISVDILIELAETQEKLDSSIISRKILLHSDVEIKKDFNIHKRVASIPENIKNIENFPGDINDIKDLDCIFDPPIANLGDIMGRRVLNPNEEMSIWRRNLNYKIFARGGEDVIEVHHAYLQENDGPIRRLSNNHPIYEANPDNCVDMMFVEEPPSRVLVPGSYCLGHCAKPVLLNSSGA